MANFFASALQRLSQRAGIGPKPAETTTTASAAEAQQASTPLGDPKVEITSPAQEYAPRTQNQLRKKADFDQEMAPYRYIAEISEATPAASAAIALRSMDKTIFDEEMRQADTPTRTQLQTYKRMVAAEGDPLSERAFKVRKTALLENAISSPENREALMQALAVAEVSAGQESLAVSLRTQEMFDAAKDPAGIPAALRDTVFKHAQDMEIGNQSVIHKRDRDLPLRMDELADPEYSPTLEDVSRINQALIDNGALLDDYMRTDVKAMSYVIEQAQQVRQGEAEMKSPRYALDQVL